MTFSLICLAAWALVLRTACHALAALFLRLIDFCTGDAR